jgi:DNA-binding transcriptional LysR family regulator
VAKPGAIALRSIRYVVAIADEGSFARAAEKLNITQPALSRCVQTLERTLEVRLFDRGRSGATPTVFGRSVIERGRPLLSDATAIVDEIAALSGAETGHVAIGVGAYPAEISVGQAVARLLTEHPRIRVRVEINDWPELTERVIEEKIDLAVCELTSAEQHPRLTVESLPPHRGYLFCRAGHPLAGKKTVDLDEIREFPFALTAVPPRLAGIIAGVTDRGGDAAAPAAHVDTFQLARAIVLGSDAIGAAIPLQLANDVEQGRAVFLPISLDALTTRYGFIHLAGRTLAPSLRALMEIIRTVEADHEATRRSARRRRRPTRGS